MRLRHRKVVQRHAAEQPQDASSAESEIILREDQQEVVSALSELPSRQREALVLWYRLDLREAEIAQAMGISAGSVKVHTSRGMAAVAKASRGKQ